MSFVNRAAHVAFATAFLFGLGCQSAKLANGVALDPKTPPSATTSDALPPLPRIPDRSFNVKEHGAMGDGIADETAAIQKALDAAGAAGGGTVVVPAGTFLAGPIDLSTGTCLSLHEGAVLRMLPFGRYPAPAMKKGDTGKESGEYPSFINANKVSDVSIVGPGLIDGQGQPWWEEFRAKKLTAKRPVLIRMGHAERVSLVNLRLKDSPMFHTAINSVKDLTVDGVTINTPPDAPNTDGVDFKGTNIVVKNCSISTGDDNIAFGGPTSNVRIFDCRFGRGHGVSMGSHTRGGISNVSVNNCTFERTESGLRGKSQRGRGGLVQNVSYSNIVMREVKNPILFTSYYGEKNSTPELDTAEPLADLTPRWKNIVFKNIDSKTTGKERHVATVWGVPEAPIEDFTFENVRLEAPEAFKIYHAKNIVFSGNSSVVTTVEQPFSLYDATGVRTPDGKTHTVGNEIARIGEQSPGAAPAPSPTPRDQNRVGQ